MDSNVFSEWIRDWERILKEPKEVALSAEYLPNLLPVAIEVLERWTRSNRNEELSADSDHDAGLAVRLLRYAFVADDVVRLLKQELPDEIGSLETLLAQETIDAQQVREILEALRATLSDDLVRRNMRAQLALGEGANRGVLRGAAVVLACRSLGRFTRSQLQKLLSRSFAEAVTSVLLEESADRISGCAEVEAHVATLNERAVHEAAKQDALRVAASGGGHLFELFGDDAWWRRSAYRLISHLRRLWTEKLHEMSQSSDNSSPTLTNLVGRLREDRQAQLEMAQELVEHYATALFRRQIRPVVRQDAGLPSPMLGEAAEALERALAGLGISNYPGPFGDDPESFPPTRTRSAEALATALPIALSEAFARSYVTSNADLVLQTAARLGKRLTELLAAEPALSEASGTAEGVQDPGVLCTAWSSRRSLHRAVGDILFRLNPSIDEHLRRLSHNALPEEASKDERFWSLWRRYYAGEASYSSRIPWNVVEPDMLDGIVNRVISRLFGARSEYLVVFRVQDLNPEGLSWPMGHVTFYDPARFDYGEGSLFPLPVDGTPAISHAAVRVGADTPSTARRLARQRLFECLDCLSFGLSGNSLRPGFNPKVSDGEYIVSLSAEVAGFNYERTVDTHDEQRAEALDLPAMARAYGFLLRKSSDDPNSLTPLQEQFIRAVHWSREARWEGDFAKKFVLHYVGLEHIFARGERKKRDAIQRRAPKLNKTWRNIGTPLVFLNMSFQRTLKLIENDDQLRAIADSDESLRGWERDERVLLDPRKTKALLDLVPATRPDARNSVSHLLEELENFASDSAGIAAYVERLRDYQLFKIGRLVEMRNDVVHEALYQDERIAFYAEEAREILDDALDKMVGDVVRTNPECEDIDDLIARYDTQPWVDATAN